ncbi:unnamed protein product, partial [Medioppia subpectinata]
RDSTKTDYTYAQSYSYNRRIERSKLFDWSVPNMSRKSIRSSSAKSVTSKSTGIVSQNSGQGLEAEIELSDNAKYAMHNRLNHQILGDYRHKGYRISRKNSRQLYDYNVYDKEAITAFKIVTNIFKTTINSTSKLIDSVTPPVLKRVYNKCPSLRFFIVLLPFLAGFVYLMSQYKSSPNILWSSSASFSPLDCLTIGGAGGSDMASKHAINELIKEMKTIRYDLQSLKDSNNAFTESIEHKLTTTVDRFEIQMTTAKTSYDQSLNLIIADMKSQISQALAIYDADKTGQHDFALESAGGAIVKTRCSESFNPYGVQYKVFGIPFWSSSVSPRAVIQPTISPGECWAFRGSNGYLVIKLSQPIRPTGFSYEHIPKQISRDGNIDSAPKEFQVRGLDSESDPNGRLLGNYVYEDN